LWLFIREQTGGGYTPCCLEEDLHPPHPHLFAVMRDRGEDGAQRLEAHGDVQQMSSEEEVVVMAEDGHGGVPYEIQEGLAEEHNETLIRQ